MAAKPTPRVMPTKNFPSRVNFRRRGGRIRLRKLDTHPRKGEMPLTMSPGLSEGNRNTTDDVAHGGFCFVACGNEAVGLGGQAHAVRENGHREILDVVGDTVMPAAQQGTRAGGVPERHGCAGGGAER